MGGSSRRAHLAPLGPAADLPTASAAALTGPARSPSQVRPLLGPRLVTLIAVAVATVTLSSWRLHHSPWVGGSSSGGKASTNSVSRAAAQVAPQDQERVIRFPQPLQVQIERTSTSNNDAQSTGGSSGAGKHSNNALSADGSADSSSSSSSQARGVGTTPTDDVLYSDASSIVAEAKQLENEEAAAVAAAADVPTATNVAGLPIGATRAGAGPGNQQEGATGHSSSTPVVPQSTPGVAPAPCQPAVAGSGAAAPAVPPQLAAQSTAAGSGHPAGPAALTNPLWWHGPIWSGSGYGSEAVNFVLSLLRSGLVRREDIWVTNHGDHARQHVVSRMSLLDRSDLTAAEARPAAAIGGARDRPAVVVCHSMPPNYAVPEPAYWAGERCPPDPKRYGWSYSVARTMFESDGIPLAFVPRCNSMNEVWVPSEWQRETFIASGVDAAKIRVVPEGVNTSYFDPVKHAPLTDLAARAQLVLGRSWAEKTAMMATTAPSVGSAGDGSSSSRRWRGNKQRHRWLMRAGPFVTAGGGEEDGSSGSEEQSPPAEPFRFVSSFKWEPRKGWELLLEAYLSEFTADDPVELYILTKPFGDSGDGFADKMRTWATQQFGKPPPPPPRPPPRPPVQVHGVRPDGLLVVTPSETLPTTTTAAAAPASAPQLPPWQFVAQAAATTVVATPIQHRRQRQLLQLSAPAARTQADTTRMEGGVFPSFSEAELARQAASEAAKAIHDWVTAHMGPQQQSIDEEDSAADAFEPEELQTQQTPSAGSKGLLAPGLAGTVAAVQRRRLSAEAAAVGSVGAGGEGMSPEGRVVAGKLLNVSAFPALYVINTHLSDKEFPRFYASGDAFVLPSRGEGWGRPQVEAMAMALPVIATNWSGITAYLDESVGYPLAVAKMVPSAGEVWNRGLSWAHPSVSHLKTLIRRVVERRAEAAARGAAARARMVERYSPAAVARLLLEELRRIEALLPQFD